MQDSLTTPTEGTQLQPQGSSGVQPGQSDLQPQTVNGATIQSQSTGQPQQDVLGPQAYRSFDGLKVQGTPVVQQNQAAVGKGSSEVFFVMFFVLLACSLIALRRYMQKPNKVASTVSKEGVAALEEAPKAAAIVKPPKKPSKKNKPKSKAVKKTKSKKKKNS